MHWFPSNDFLRDFKLQDFVLSKFCVKSFNWALVPFSWPCFWQLEKQGLIIAPLCCRPAQSPRFSATHPSRTTDLSLLSAFIGGTTITDPISLLQLTSRWLDPPIPAGFSVPPFPTLIQWNPYCRYSRPPGVPRIRSCLSRAARLTSLVAVPCLLRLWYHVRVTTMLSFSIHAGTGMTLTHWCNAQSIPDLLVCLRGYIHFWYLHVRSRLFG